MSKSYLAVLAVLLVAALLGMAVAEDPGYLLIAWRNVSLETSVWVGLAFLLALWLTLSLLRALVRLLNASGRKINPWSRHNRQRRAHQVTTRGLLEFAEGHWKTAQRLLHRAAPAADQPLINYLAAARAAHEQGDYAGADELLREAYESTPKAEVAIAVTQAQLQLARGQYEQALATLTRLRKRYPKHVFALKLMSRLYLRLQDWERLEALLPELRKQKVLPADDLQQLEREVYKALLQQAGERGKHQAPGDMHPLTSCWQRVPKGLRQDQDMLAVYCVQLRLLGLDTLAEEALRAELRQNYSDHLMHLYGLLEGADPQRQLATAEKWLSAQPHNPVLLLALGRLSLRNQLWGKAREYLEASFHSKKDIQTCAELVRLLDQLGEVAASQQVLRQGFELMAGDLPALPLPQRALPAE
ncbi:MAG: heme biosynthesis protein HemY [Pseudomonadaceae bacterium]|nr:MAG: heme biosynthesis protein HemY [Pseudomonadaceae bacterium]